MFCEMRLLINDIMMNHIHFISDETAATVLDLAIRIGEAEGGDDGGRYQMFGCACSEKKRRG